jgi:hypothetical protein
MISFLDEVHFIPGPDYELPFEIPRNFNNPGKYEPRDVPEAAFEEVPNEIGQALFDSIGLEVPNDPLIIFSYVRHGRLSLAVVAYFFHLQKKKKLTNQTRFYRAMWLISMFRDYVMLPPLHPLASFDTVAVQNVGRLVGDDGVRSTVEEASGSAEGAGVEVVEGEGQPCPGEQVEEEAVDQAAVPPDEEHEEARGHDDEEDVD